MNPMIPYVCCCHARHRGMLRAWLGLIWAFVTRSEGLARQLVYRSRETGAVSVSKAVPKHDSAENLSRARPELRFAMSLWPQRGRVGKGADVRSNVGPMWSNVTSISHPPSVPCASESEILTLVGKQRKNVIGILHRRLHFTLEHWDILAKT